MKLVGRIVERIPDPASWAPALDFPLLLGRVRPSEQLAALSQFRRNSPGTAPCFGVRQIRGDPCLRALRRNAGIPNAPNESIVVHLPHSRHESCELHVELECHSHRISRATTQLMQAQIDQTIECWMSDSNASDVKDSVLFITINQRCYRLHDGHVYTQGIARCTNLYLDAT